MSIYVTLPPYDNHTMTGTVRLPSVTTQIRMDDLVSSSDKLAERQPSVDWSTAAPLTLSNLGGGVYMTPPCEKHAQLFN